MASRVNGQRAPELQGFREVQRLAYACAEAVAARLRPGVTEREAARMQREWLSRRGVRDWFHLPFAWFGDRTAFTGFKVPLRFFPADRVTERHCSSRMFGFGTQPLRGLLSDAVRGHREGWSPLWSPYRCSGHPPQPGLWAVEPHPGFRGTGAKFGEILVVTDSRDSEQSAFWLDDDLPHVRRWAEERVAA